MDVGQAVRTGSGLFWFAIGTLMMISGAVYTVTTLVSADDDRPWYAGPIAIVLGFFLAGYLKIIRSVRAARKQAPPA